MDFCINKRYVIYGLYTGSIIFLILGLITAMGKISTEQYNSIWFILISGVLMVFGFRLSGNATYESKSNPNAYWGFFDDKN